MTTPPIERVALKLHSEHIKRFGSRKPTSRTIVRVVTELLAEYFEEIDSDAAPYLRAALKGE